DVVVTDGFSGNITLKSIEGTASYVLDLLKGVLTSSLKTKLAAGLIKSDLMSLKEQLDYPEFGGAALFGLKAPVIKSHGSSNKRVGDLDEKNSIYVPRTRFTSSRHGGRFL